MAKGTDKPTALSEDNADQARGGSAIIQRVEDKDLLHVHGADFNSVQTNGIAAMGNSAHVHGSNFNAAHKK